MSLEEKNRAHTHICPPSVVKWLNSPFRKLIQNPFKIMKDYVSPGDTVVDLGCGGGYFAVALAKMVGESGKVIAVDLQQEMLNITRDFALKKGILDRITLHLCSNDDIGLAKDTADFALSFYVLHEVPDKEKFLRQVVDILKPEAHFMLIEPKHHVKDFQHEIELALNAGLKQVKPVKLLGSKGVLFKL